MGLNKATNDFMDKLADLINNSGLPPVIVRLTLDAARAQLIEIEKKAIEEEAAMDAKAEQAEEPEENA